MTYNKLKFLKELMKTLLLFFPFLLFSLNAETIPFTRSESSPLPAVKRQRIVPRTLMYTEIQYKYGLFQNFLGGYIDRPLFFNREYRYTGNFVSMTEKSFLRDCEIRLSYGFDGGGSLCSVPSLFRTYEKALMFLDHNPQLAHYREFPQFCFGEMGKYVINEDYAHRVIEAALKSKHSPKINGRIPISTYNSARMPLPALEKFLAGLKQKFGDTFVIFGEFAIDHSDEDQFYERGGWTDRHRAKYKKRISDILRVFGAVQLRVGSRRLQTGYMQAMDFRLWDQEIEPILFAELNKPENREKLVCGVVQHGYINHMSGVNLSEDCTGSAREIFNRLLVFNPDMVLFFEWNEFNENTCWQPTLYNSFVLQRLVRYYANVMRGEKPVPNPGDDLNVPPMALSYRETLKLGESLDFELLNIPDGSSGTYRVELELCDLQGNPLLRFPSEKFDRSVLRAVTFRVPSEKLSRQVVLMPRLIVTGADENKLVYENLQYVRLLPTFCYIYKSVRQSLRDLFTPANWEFDAKMNADGTVQLTGSLDAGEKLASLEVTDFGREIFAVDPEQEFDLGKYIHVTGVFSAPRSGMRQIRIEVPEGGEWKIRAWGFPNITLGKFTRNGDALNSRSPVRNALSRFILSIPRKNAGKAKIRVTMDGESFTTDTASILKYGSVAHAFSKSRLKLSDNRKLLDIPFPLNCPHASFSAKIRSERSYPICQMRAVSVSGKIFRSRPILPKAIPADMEELPLHSETYDTVVKIPIFRALIPHLKWTFDPAAGDVMPLNGFDPFFICDLGGGYDYDGAMFGLKLPEGRHAPRWGKEDGKNVLDFDGKSYLHFPKETFPRGSFTLKFRIKPEPLPGTKVYTLFRHYSRILGSVTVYSEQNQLCFAFGDRKLKTSKFKTGLPLEPGKWSDVEIRYDLNELVFKVNGKEKGLAFPKHLALYFKPSIFGAHTKPEFGLPKGAEMFRGKLSEISICHTAACKN